ncbi:MAG: FtsX-like permease family protein [Thermoleophilaceae bacterium]|nr:FtsX-like permease family protein [Thermoleophilaceae bacterium]
MINFPYLKAELTRRRTKTVLISIGLAVPIALTILIGAYSTGLSNAQDEVLEPLVGLGTDMTVAKTFTPGQRPEGAGPPRVDLNSDDAGEAFSRDVYTTGFNGEFSSANVTRVSALDGVQSAVGGLTVTNIKASGTIPSAASGGGQATAPGAGGAPPSGGQGGGFDIDTRTITGIDPSSDLGPVTSDQIQKGTLLSSDDAKEALLTSTYARTRSLTVGETITLKDEKFKIVGIVSSPLAGSSSDIYVKLGQLQVLADMKNKVNKIYVRAADQAAVASVSKDIKSTVTNATVTTNASLAGQVSGSLVDANKLVEKMGVFLELVLLLAAIIITTILTLNAVNKRTREFGTLKSIGWSNPLLIRQVMAESLSTGMLGALAGVAIGVAGMLVAKAVPMTMEVSGQSGGGIGGGGPGGGNFGPPGVARTATEAASQTITIVPTLSASTILIAAGIGAVTALIAGGLGSFKTSKLSPVEALKHVD